MHTCSESLVTVFRQLCFTKCKKLLNFVTRQMLISSQSLSSLFSLVFFLIEQMFLETIKSVFNIIQFRYCQ